MDTTRLEQLHRHAMQSVIARTSDAEEKTRSTRVGELNRIHIASAMDIEQTTESLKQILAYRQELANHMLECSDSIQMEQLNEAFIYSDETIKQVLGMYTP
ncbi:MAG: hypothetical protein CVU09_09510 [Bacteroidetes bacterium HGW-Bacteroidetes-4]|jgi:predicted Co/Zn/Cd cation transporter (cation efflux family)|nr:MAG: hypothetical protein CVU09_09510 [Bacteroidetes bacterium HGW-Bacteroidetes-4]